jgi:hypothetical protein
MLRPSPCVLCSHYLRHGRCLAFPDGIPLELRSGKVLHDTPYPGDNGVLFKAVPADPDAEFVFNESML